MYLEFSPSHPQSTNPTLPVSHKSSDVLYLQDLLLLSLRMLVVGRGIYLYLLCMHAQGKVVNICFLATRKNTRENKNVKNKALKAM